MSHVFISYSRQDGNEAATLLQQALEAHGFTVWRDVRDLRAGQDFTADIEKAIESASHVLVCITPDSKRKDSFVRREINYGLLIDDKRHKSGETLPVIPLRFNEIEPHISIVNNEWVDFFHDWKTAFDRLRAILSGAAYENQLSGEASDPYKAYLQYLLERVNSYLKQAIIRQIEDLPAEAAPDAVATRSALIPIAKPVDQFQLLFDALPIGADAEAEQRVETPITSFREGFERYNQRVLLLGEPGAGKTITLMAQARNATNARLDDVTQPLPLLGIIATWDSREQTPLARWLATISGGHLTEPTVQAVLDEGCALLLLDGLDELGSERRETLKGGNTEEKVEIYYDPRIRLISAINAQIGTNRALITCRVMDYQTIGQQVGLDGAIRLRQLSNALIRKYLADYPGLWTLLENDANLIEITRTPLLLSLFAFAFRDLSDAERAELHHLTDAFDLRDKIFKFYVEKRYKHEAARHELAFDLKTICNVLGRVTLEKAVDRNTHENVIQRKYLESALANFADERGGIALSVFTELTIRLHYLSLGEGDVFRFIHLLLHNYFAFQYAPAYLQDANRHLRLAAVDSLLTLGNLGDMRTIEPLITALNDQDGNIRGSAAEGLGELGDPSAIEPLIHALGDVHDFVSSRAAEALEKIGAKAVDLLIRALAASNPKIRQNAVDVLGTLGDARVVEPLVSALSDADKIVRHSAAKALRKIGDVRAVEPLIRVLADTDTDVRLSAAAALGQTGDTRAVKPLIRALADINADVRRRAAVALGQTGDTRAVKPLIRALADADANVRRSAAVALKRIGAPAVKPLIRALTDTNSDVRHSVAAALGQIGDARAVRPLIRVLADTDTNVRRNASAALKHIGAPAVKSLIHALTDANWNIRRGAADALGESGDKTAVEPLIRALKDVNRDVRLSASAALGIVGDTRAIEPLISALADVDKYVGSIAADALGRLGDERAVEPLILTLWDIDTYVGSSAAIALQRIGTPQAKEAVETWWKKERGG